MVLTHVKFITSSVPWPIPTPKLCGVIIATTAKKTVSVTKEVAKLDKYTVTDKTITRMLTGRKLWTNLKTQPSLMFNLVLLWSRIVSVKDTQRAMVVTELRNQKHHCHNLAKS